MLAHFITAIKGARELVTQPSGEKNWLTFKRFVIQREQSPLNPPMPQRLAEDGESHDDERRPLAYRKWQEAGCPNGDGVQFWLDAEKEIQRR